MVAFMMMNLCARDCKPNLAIYVILLLNYLTFSTTNDDWCSWLAKVSTPSLRSHVSSSEKPTSKIVKMFANEETQGDEQLSINFCFSLHVSSPIVLLASYDATCCVRSWLISFQCLGRSPSCQALQCRTSTRRLMSLMHTLKQLRVLHGGVCVRVHAFVSMSVWVDDLRAAYGMLFICVMRMRNFVLLMYEYVYIYIYIYICVCVICIVYSMLLACCCLLCLLSVLCL